jgi:hypothetical protein
VRSSPSSDANPLTIFTEPVPPARTVIKAAYEYFLQQSKICGN